MSPEESIENSLRLNEICSEFAASWNTESKADIVSHLAKVKPDTMEALLRRLLQVDIAQREQAGQSVAPADYVEVHPSAESLVAQWFEDTDKATRQVDSLGTDPVRSEEVGDTITAAPNRDSVDSQFIGRYRLIQKIGEGGMGTVWLAEQSQPIRRKVAVKVIKTGMDSRQIVARFEAERQALAMMDHPNIARVVDVGVSDDGSPFFAMELVNGLPLARYCDNQQLTIRKRLEIFVDVCNGVQHAHQKGIIHRDLKPANILVSGSEDIATPKVIDFGLAKAMQIETRLTDKTVFTEFGQILGTLQYMSPEQANLNDLYIDTRTDVYTLGVILYELLTGSTPMRIQSMRELPILKALECLREQDSPRPSDRVTDSTESLENIAEKRSVAPQKLPTALRKELDWIALKALEKSPNQRYQTAADLGRDVQRYLDGDVVEARPHSAVYRTKKFVRKHRGPVAALTAIAFSLVLGIAGSVWFAIKANESRKKETVAKTEALRQKDIAYERLDMSIEAVENYYSGVNEDIVLKDPRLKDLRAKLLQQPIAFFERLTQDLEKDSSVEARGRLADALLSLYHIQQSYGDGEEALGSIESATELFQQLYSENPDDRQLLLSLVQSEYYRISQFLNTDESAWKRKNYPKRIRDSAIQLAIDSETLLSFVPDDPSLLALCLAVYGQNCVIFDPQIPENKELNSKYLERASMLAIEIPMDKLDKVGLSLAIGGSGHVLAYLVLAQTDPNDLAMPILEKQIGFLESKAAHDIIPNVRLNYLAERIDTRIIARRSKPDSGDTLPDYQQLYDLRMQTLELDPTELTLMRGAGRAAYSVAARLKERGQLEKADQWAIKAATHFEEVLSVDASAINAMAMLQMINQLRGDVLLDLEKFEEAIIAYQASQKIESYHGHSGAGPTNTMIVYAKAKLGKHDEVLEEVSDLAKELHPAHSFLLAQALSVCVADTDVIDKKAELHTKAIELLERAFSSEHTEDNMQTFENAMRANPDFAALRNDEKFQEMFARVTSRETKP